MENGLRILYQCFGIIIYGIAIVLLLYYSRSIEEMEKHFDRLMYQQHVISNEIN